MSNRYPMCLYFLDLLQHENFRKEIVNGQCCKFIDDQMILHWQHYTRKRMRLLETGVSQQAGQTPATQPTTTSTAGVPSQLPLPTSSSPANLINGHSQGQKV